MLYILVMVLFFVVALLFLLVALKLIVNSSWFSGWLRGNAGIIFLAIAAFIGVAGYDFRNFSSYKEDKVVFTLSLEGKGSGQFVATLATNDGAQMQHLLTGKSWRLQADSLHWSKRFKTMGASDGYRLEKLVGVSPSDAQQPSSEVILKPEPLLGVDAVNVIAATQNYVSLLARGRLVSEDFPLVDGAIFDLSFSGKKILASPVNAIAKNAVEVR